MRWMVGWRQVLALGGLMGVLWLGGLAGWNGGVAAWASRPVTAGVPIRVLPLGDSITQGNSLTNSYRRILWQMLQETGVLVDFVGSTNTNYGGPPPNPDFDLDHEGHWGWTADEILTGRLGEAGLSSWLQGYTPDVVLLHVGTNDLADAGAVDSTVSEVGRIVGRLRDENPRVAVLIAQIIPTVYPEMNGRIERLNRRVAEVVGEEGWGGAPMGVVDMYSDFDPDELLYDGVHPNERGEREIARRWLEALNVLLEG